MCNEKYDFVLYIFSGEDTAEHVYGYFCEKERKKDIDILNAAVAYRRTDSRLRLDHKIHTIIGRGTVLGFLLGALAGGPLAVALAGALVGPARLKWRSKIGTTLERQLRRDQSALAIIINTVDWSAFDEATEHIMAIPIMAELTLETMDLIQELIENDEIAEAISAEIVEEVTPGARDSL